MKIRTITIRLFALAALCALALSFGCARGGSSVGEGVKVISQGKTRIIPAECFDEADYLKRGYLKNTDGQGRVIYVLIPDTDKKKDDTFIGGGGGGETSWGGRAGRNIGNFRTFDSDQ